jgi:hypothetical protein
MSKFSIQHIDHIVLRVTDLEQHPLLPNGPGLYLGEASRGFGYGSPASWCIHD